MKNKIKIIKIFLSLFLFSASNYRGAGQSSGYRRRGWFSSSGQAGSSNLPSGSGYSPSAPPGGDGYEESAPHYSEYTAGMSEEEQYRRAMENSRQEFASAPPLPSAPPPSPGSVFGSLIFLLFGCCEKLAQWKGCRSVFHLLTLILVGAPMIALHWHHRRPDSIFGL